MKEVVIIDRKMATRMSKQVKKVIGGVVALIAGIITISTYFNLSKEGTISVFGVILLFCLIIIILRGTGRIETSIEKLSERISKSIRGDEYGRKN